MNKRGFYKKKGAGRISPRIYLLTLFITCLSSAVFGTLNVSLSDQGTGVSDKVAGELLASGNLTVEIYDSLTDGNLVYNETFENAIVNGSWNVMLGENASNPLALEYGKVYYRDYSINGEDVSFTNLTGDAVGRQFFYSPLGDVGSDDLADSAVTSPKLEQSINLSNATGYLWDNLFGIPLTFPSSTDKAADGFYLYNDTSTIYLNESQLNLTINSEASAYNDTGYVDNQLLNYYAKTEVYNRTESDDRYVENETDPVFLIENLSLWTEALNKFNSTYDAYAYNQTSPAIAYVNSQDYVPSAELNRTYLLIGENETGGSVGWGNVVFMNDTFLNDTYLLLDENASIWTAIFNRLTSAELNASYLLKGENETSIFLPTNVVFMNESLLNDTYLLKAENETGSVDWSNVAFINDTVFNTTYLFVGENATDWVVWTNVVFSNNSNTYSAVQNFSEDVFMSGLGLTNCQGKLITDSSGNVTCGIDATSEFTPTNVVFYNETTLNDTYLFRGENLTAADPDLSNVMFLNDTNINASYLLKGENETNNVFLPVNVAFVNESNIFLLNQNVTGVLDAYGLTINGSAVITSFTESDPIFINENVSLWIAALDKYNATYDTWAYNQTQPAIDYVSGQGYLVNGSTVELGTINITGDAFLPVQSLGGCNGKLITSADGNITCGTDQTGSGMDYTNVAMTNQSNTFTAGQVVDGTLNITGASGVTGLYVDSSGRVGIGTTGPNAGLQVVGGLTQDTGMSLINRILHGGRRDIFAGVTDGFGQSAPVRNTWMQPIMTNYSSPYASFWGGVFDGQNIWLVPNSPTGEDYLVKVNPSTGEMTNYSNPYGSNAFFGGVFDGQNIWLVPDLSEFLVKVNPSTGEMTNYSHSYGGIAGYGNNAFAGGVFDGQKIWLVPNTQPNLVEVDPSTGEMINHSTNNSFLGGVFDGQNIWLVPSSGPYLVKVDPSTGATTNYSNSYGLNNDFAGGVFDGQNIWLVPYNADYLVKVDPSTGAMTNYSHSYGNYAFRGGVFDGQNIWLVPNNADYLVKVDPSTGAMTNYSHSYGDNAFFGGVFDGQNIWLVPNTADYVVKIRPQEFGVESLFTSGVLNVGGYLADRTTLGTSIINGNLAVTNGNVGIGTVSPTSKLEVEGTFNATGGSGSGIYVGADGNVSIGESGGTFEDLIVYGNIYYDGALVSFSPMIVQSADDLPVPVCMKNAAGLWVGCMPDENNNWVCSQNEECDRKLLRMEVVRSLSQRDLRGEEIDEKVSKLIGLAEKGDVEGLTREASSLGVDLGNLTMSGLKPGQRSSGSQSMNSVSPASSTDVSGACVCVPSEESGEETRKEMEVLRAEIDLMRREMENLKGKMESPSPVSENLTASEGNLSNDVLDIPNDSGNQT